MSVQQSGSARLGEHLVACRAVTRAQWDEAVARAGSGDTRDALNILSRARAHWAPESDRGPVPALTEYQIEQIGEWLAAPHGPFPAERLVWNNYLLLDKLAAGGMGVVFKGWCPVHGRYVAIKRTLSDSGDLRRRLRRESDLLRQLSHPAVAEFYARESLDQDDLLVMEFVPGKTLFDVTQERLAKRSPVPWASVAGWAVDLLGALGHLDGGNAAGVVMVHRDVKPSNVMLRPDGKRYRAVLVDFGLARAAEGGHLPEGQGETAKELTNKFQFLGTPEYAAPEQWHGGRFALPASDVYSLGGTLFYALAGRAPFGPMPSEAATPIAALMQMMTRHRADPRPRVRADRPDVPPELEQLIVQMLAVDPLERGSVAALRARFEALLAGTGSAVEPIPARRSEPPKSTPPAPQPPRAAPPPEPRPAPPAPAPSVPWVEDLPRPAPKAPPASAPEPAPAPAPAPAPVLKPETATYQLETGEPPSGDAGPGTGRRKRPSKEVPRLPETKAVEVEVEAAAPPTPATAEVFGAFLEWSGARLGGPRRASAGRLWREFVRRGGAWLRAYARPLAHPGRWTFLLGTVALVGLTAGWDWSFVPLAVVGLLAVFAHLAEE